MTDRVSPSPGSLALGYQAAMAIRYGGQTDGWVLPSGDVILADVYEDITTPVGQFGVVSTSSNTVTVDSGEAFVGGANLARDTETGVDLPTESGTYSVYLGWAASANNTVIIDTQSAFGGKDPQIELIEVTVDSGTITDTQYVVDNEPYISSAEDANNLGGLSASEYATLAENETVTGEWTHESDLNVSGSNVDISGRLDVRANHTHMRIHETDTDKRWNVGVSSGNLNLLEAGDNTDGLLQLQQNGNADLRNGNLSTDRGWTVRSDWGRRIEVGNDFSSEAIDGDILFVPQ